MQIAGQACGICWANVSLEREGSWCARCDTVVHRHCLEEQGDICPKCSLPFDHPERYFVTSELCPECFNSNQPGKSACYRCGARTVWDSKDRYDEFVLHMHSVAGVMQFRALVELGFGLLCVVVLVGCLVANRTPGVMGLAALVLGFMSVTIDGILRYLRSRQVQAFR